MDETWSLYVTCEGATRGQQSSTIRLPRQEINLESLTSIQLQLGYSARDYLYYKKRCGNAATLHEIEYPANVDAMIQCNEQERQVRLLCCKEKKVDVNVNISPLKVARIRQQNIDDDDDDDIDAYKKWLENMHKENKYTGKRYVGWIIYIILFYIAEALY